MERRKLSARSVSCSSENELEGKKLWESGVVGSNEDWSAVKGRILATNHVDRFPSNLGKLHESREPDWVEFVRQWWVRFKDKRMGVGGLMPGKSLSEKKLTQH